MRKRDKDCSWANIQPRALNYYPGFYPFQRLHLSTVLHSHWYDRRKKASRVTKFARWLKFFFLPSCYRPLHNRREIVPIKNSITYNATASQISIFRRKFRSHGSTRCSFSRCAIFYDHFSHLVESLKILTNEKNKIKKKKKKNFEKKKNLREMILHLRWIINSWRYCVYDLNEELLYRLRSIEDSPRKMDPSN